jgi:hypothetical protein
MKDRRSFLASGVMAGAACLAAPVEAQARFFRRRRTDCTPVATTCADGSPLESEPPCSRILSYTPRGTRFTAPYTVGLGGVKFIYVARINAGRVDLLDDGNCVFAGATYFGLPGNPAGQPRSVVLDLSYEDGRNPNMATLMGFTTIERNPVKGWINTSGKYDSSVGKYIGSYALDSDDKVYTTNRQDGQHGQIFRAWQVGDYKLSVTFYHTEAGGIYLRFHPPFHV